MAGIAVGIASVKTELAEAIGRLDAILTHVDGSQELSPILRVTISNSVIVALISTLEESLRNAFSEYLRSVAEDISPYSQLRGSLRESNLEAGIKLLSTHRKEVNWSESRAVVDALEKCLSDASPYSLFRDRLSLNDGNFRSRQLSITAQRSGVPEIWRLIVNAPEVEAYIAESNLDTRKNKIIQAWNDVFDERDTIVHRVSRATGWGSNRIREALELGKLVFDRLCDCLTHDADELKATFQARNAAQAPPQ